MRGGIVTAGRAQARGHFSRDVHGGDQEDGRSCLPAGSGGGPGRRAADRGGGARAGVALGGDGWRPQHGC